RRRRQALSDREDITRRLPAGEPAVECVASLVDLPGRHGGLDQIDDRLREELPHVYELGLLGNREADPVQLEQAPREGRAAVVQRRPLESNRGFVRDRREELQIALVVRRDAAALRGDRADERVALPEGRDDDRLLDHGAPRLEVGETETARGALHLL